FDKTLPVCLGLGECIDDITQFHERVQQVPDKAEESDKPSDGNIAVDDEIPAKTEQNNDTYVSDELHQREKFRPQFGCIDIVIPVYHVPIGKTIDFEILP